MAKIQSVWALDVGQAALKALKLKLVPAHGETPEQVEAEAFDFVEFPKILSQPDADPEQLIREAFETFLERNDLKGSKVAIAVPGQAGLVKFIKLPPVEKKRIPDIVKFEARQQIPFALEEVVWDYQQIGGDDEEAAGDDDFTMAEVGLFAMKRDQINRAIQPFRAAGIEVDIVQMGPIALYNYITFDKIKGSGSKDSVVLLDIGADNTDLIITDGVRIWQRNVPIGGNHFTRALTKELKLTFAKAEHLKRNATKAPDPRSIFTAMRGVFNDFANEVNRSIGFYGSSNKGAKITKVIGLGNGFKLPGLQKFLQQNLTAEIEKLDEFARLTGDEVKGQPVFLDNLPSFAVVYGLALQGLGRSAIRTNLLPPEIEKVRLIRAKKPWALAASALLMLGFSALFLGDYRVLARVEDPKFKTAVDSANGEAKTGAKYKSDLEAAKGAWKAKFDEGQKLVGSAADRGMWPDFLKTIGDYFPDPVRDYKLDPSKPENQHKLDTLRVHIDAIKPVWRTDLAKEWFDDPAVLKPEFKNLMHAVDRGTPPTGEGWVVQVVGHHFNPLPTTKEEQAKPEGARTEFGPYGYLVKKIIPMLNDPRLRFYGVHHVALAWMVSDRKWTTEKGAQNNGLASTTVPILARAAAPVSAEGSGVSGGGGMLPPGPPLGAPPNLGSSASMMMPGMYAASGLQQPAASDTSKLTTLTRTDFLIQFVWQPKKAEDKPKTEEDLHKAIDEERKKLVDAQKNKSEVNISEVAIENASRAQSKVVEGVIEKAAKAPTGLAPGAPPAAAPAPPAPAR